MLGFGLIIFRVGVFFAEDSSTDLGFARDTTLVWGKSVDLCHVADGHIALVRVAQYSKPAIYRAQSVVSPRSNSKD